MTIFIKEGSSPPRYRAYRSPVSKASFPGAEQTEVVRCWQRMVYINDKNAGYW